MYGISLPKPIGEEIVISLSFLQSSKSVMKYFGVFGMINRSFDVVAHIQHVSCSMALTKVYRLDRLRIR